MLGDVPRHPGNSNPQYCVSERVLKLSCTSDDIIPLTKACDFNGRAATAPTSGKNPKEPNSAPPTSRPDVEHILSTFSNAVLHRLLRPPIPTNSFGTRGTNGALILESFEWLARTH